MYVMVACTDFETDMMLKLERHPLISVLESVQPLGKQLYPDAKQ